MATVVHFDTEDLMGLFNPRRCGNYFNEPNLLQEDIEGFLRNSGRLEWPINIVLKRLIGKATLAN